MTELETALAATVTVNGHVSHLEIVEEREPLDSYPDSFPCPDILWQGLFAVIGERLKKFTWEVWLGALCGLGATAHKNLSWQYYRPLFGMVYGLLVSPTGTGKGLCTDVCRALLPEYYTVRRAVSSGAGLFPILARIEKNDRGKILAITPRPAILVIEEWTVLLKASKVEFSNLQDTLNELFHTLHPFNVSRSDTEKAGGDREVPNPTLSICATTTASLLREQVSTKMIRSGFLNRYFIVPGSGATWDFYDEEQAGVDVGKVKGIADHLKASAWGNGYNVWEAYSRKAKERLVEWGRLFFNPLMASQTIEAESLKRLHVYAHVISLLYAWSEEAREVLPRHVDAAIAAVTVSRAFVEKLLSEHEVEIPKFKQYEMSVEKKIIDKVHREPGVTIKKVAEDLRASGTYRDLSDTARRMAKEGQLLMVKRGKSETLYPLEK